MTQICSVKVVTLFGLWEIRIGHKNSVSVWRPVLTVVKLMSKRSHFGGTVFRRTKPVVDLHHPSCIAFCPVTPLFIVWSAQWYLMIHDDRYNWKLTDMFLLWVTISYWSSWPRQSWRCYITILYFVHACSLRAQTGVPPASRPFL